MIEKKQIQDKTNHIPKDSILFEKIIPISLIVMGVVMAGLIVFAAGVLFGVVNF